MPRGRRRVTAEALEAEMASLKQRMAEIRAGLRRIRSGTTGVRKLEQKLEKQLAAAKWTVGLIKEIDAGWDEMRFYTGVQPRQPTPRGRRPRAAAK
jgi:hypothetical protein